jgi:hypothetical protein
MPVGSVLAGMLRNAITTTARQLRKEIGTPRADTRKIPATVIESG